MATPIRCSAIHVSRTNIDINDDLVEIVIMRYHLKTKREAVDCLILAVAQRTDAAFATRDRRQAELGRLVGVELVS